MLSLFFVILFVFTFTIICSPVVFRLIYAFPSYKHRYGYIICIILYVQISWPISRYVCTIRIYYVSIIWTSFYIVCQWLPIPKNLLNAFCTRPLNVKLCVIIESLKKSFQSISTFFEMNKLNENNLVFKILYPSSKYIHLSIIPTL